MVAHLKAAGQLIGGVGMWESQAVDGVPGVARSGSFRHRGRTVRSALWRNG